MRSGRPHLALTLAIVAVGLAACGGTGWQASGTLAGAQSLSEEPIEHARGREALVVSVSDAADGLTVAYAPWYAAGRPARFLLYGDGTVIVPVSVRPGRIPALATYRLSEAGIQAVLREAESAGLLAGSLDYGQPEILDVGSTLVTLRADGREIFHAAYALGLDDSVRPQRRRALAGYIDYLETLAAARPDLLAAPLRPYQPGSVDVFAWAHDGDAGWNGSEVRLDWPLARPLSSLPVSEVDSDAGCASIRAAEVAAVADALAGVPAGGSFPIWRSGKRSWIVAFDVNLPGEAPCPGAGNDSAGAGQG